MDSRINQMMAKPEYRSGNHPLAALVQAFKPATRKIQDEIAHDAERADLTRQNGEQQVRTNQASSEKRRIDRDDPYFQALSQGWSASLREAFARMAGLDLGEPVAK